MTVSVKAVEAKLTEFHVFLKAAGAEVLKTTNDYEVTRFRTGTATSVIYRTDKGSTTFTGESEKAWEAYRSSHPWKPALATITGRRDHKIKKASPVVRTIRERDGDACFFCWRDVTDDDASLEHLVPLSHGGPSHTSNLFLAHKVCNSKAGHLSAPEKVRLHVAEALKRNERWVRRDIKKEGAERLRGKPGDCNCLGIRHEEGCPLWLTPT